MTNRRTRKIKGANYEESSKYMIIVERVIDSLMPFLKEIDQQLIASHHIGPFSGEASDFDVWLIYLSKNDSIKARESGKFDKQIETLHNALANQGYPRDALATFSFHSVSQQEIDDAGGNFAFFR